MRFIRIILLVLAAAAVLLALAWGIASRSFFQTWVARRMLAQGSAWRGTVGNVAVGLTQTEIRDLRLSRAGATLTVPQIRAEVGGLAAGFGHRVWIRRLVAKGWTLDLNPAVEMAAPVPLTAAPSVPVPPAAAEAARASGPILPGIFQALRLPADLAVEAVTLEGDIILPPAPGQVPLRMHVTITGGGLGAGREGSFSFEARGVPPLLSRVESLTVDGVVAAAMDTPRTFTRIDLRMTAAAAGPKLSREVRLTGELAAMRGSGGESYTATLAGATKQLLAVVAQFPADTHRLSGTWKVDLSDDDLSPFALGRPLPVFSAAGEGQFDTAAAAEDVHVSGSLDAVLDRLPEAQSPWNAVGSLRLAADFDVTRRRTVLRVDRLAATLSHGEPVLAVRNLQAFAFDVGSGELQVADANHELLGLTLEGLPLSWLRFWAPHLELAGEPLRGEFVASARNGGLTLRTPSPLTVSRISIGWAGRSFCRDAVLALSPAADYTPQGWQVEIAPGTLRSAETNLLTWEAKIGRLAGLNQPVKLAGKFSVDLPALLAQPIGGVLGDSSPNPANLPANSPPQYLKTGRFAGEFSGIVGAASAVEAKFSLTDLVADPQFTTESLPAVTATVRADLSADGKATFSAPVNMTRAGRISDLLMTGAVRLTFSGLDIDGQVDSNLLDLEDLRALRAPFAAAPGAREAGTQPGAVADSPFWGPLAGEFKLGLHKIDSGPWAVSNVVGLVEVDSHSIHGRGLRASLDSGGRLQADGKVEFSPGQAASYLFAADLTASDLDLTPFASIGPAASTSSIEGKFDVTANVTGQGSGMGEAAARMQGRCAVTSKGGTFRLLATAFSPPATSGGKAAIGALLGDVASAVGDVISRRKGANDFVNSGQAVAELARDISSIPYDQFNFTLSRDSSFNTVCEDLALISPELRLQGGGQVSYAAETPFLNQPLALNLKLSARGRLGDALKYLGALGTKPDNLGYTPFPLPLHVGGSLAKPDTRELQSTLLKLVEGRSGANDLLNKLLGK